MTRINLFISNFKKIIKKILHLCLVFGFVFIVYAGLDYLLVKEETWGRILWHNFYEEEDNIDNVFIGSSHVYCDINPFILDEITEKNNFNLSNSSLPLNGAYFLLKEADKNHNIQHVYVELWYVLSTGSVGVLSESYIINWRNTDYMKNSLNKFEYMFNYVPMEEYLGASIPLYRYRNKITDLGHIKSITNEKSSQDYMDYQYNIETGQQTFIYMDKGYNYSTKKFLPNELHYQQNVVLEKESITEDSKEYIKKIIEYCNEHNIEITFFSSPTTKLDLASSVKYDYYVEEITAFLNDYGVNYYDFNLCKKEFLPLEECEHFRDDDHLNNLGAEMFSALFGEVMQQSYEENKKYFHSSYKEKIAADPEEAYGIIYLNDEQSNIYNADCMIASNRAEGLEYKITLLSVDGIETLIQDYNENIFFSIPDDEDGLCSIEVRCVGEEEAFQRLNINY